MENVWVWSEIESEASYFKLKRRFSKGVFFSLSVHSSTLFGQNGLFFLPFQNVEDIDSICSVGNLLFTYQTDWNSITSSTRTTEIALVSEQTGRKNATPIQCYLIFFLAIFCVCICMFKSVCHRRFDFIYITKAGNKHQ